MSLTCKYDGLVRDVEVYMIVDSKCTLRFHITAKYQLKAEGDDFFECFKEIRRMDKTIIYYCKGDKVNVFPSRMTRQMSKGLSAYETCLGVPAHKENLVNIFDFESNGLAADPLEQEEYQALWFLSLKQ